MPVAARLEHLRERYGLSDRQGAQLGAILQRLTSDPQAPTSVRDPQRVVDVHLADALVALELSSPLRAGGDRGYWSRCWPPWVCSGGRTTAKQHQAGGGTGA